MVFHEDAQDDSVTENREGIEQNTSMPPAADHDHGVSGITFVDDSVVAVVAVGDTTDLPVQEDEYDTDSESDVDNDTPSEKNSKKNFGFSSEAFNIVRIPSRTFRHLR